MPHAEGQIQGQGSRGDGWDIDAFILAQLHDGSSTELLFDLGNGLLNRSFSIHLSPLF